MAQPGEWTADRVGALLSGAGATLLRRMSSGLAVLTDEDGFPGCCLLVPDDLRIGRLTDLTRERRLSFFDDLARLGEAVHNVCARRYPSFDAVELQIHEQVPGQIETLRGGVLHAHVRPTYSSPAHESEPQVQQLLREQLVAELDCIAAASRAEFAPTHVYGRATDHAPPRADPEGARGPRTGR